MKTSKWFFICFAYRLFDKISLKCVNMLKYFEILLKILIEFYFLGDFITFFKFFANIL